MTLTIEAEADEAIDQLIADLEGARDIIADRGLVKGIFTGGIEANAPCCTVGALMTWVDGSWNNPRVERAVYALATALGVDASTAEGRRHALFDFNDEAFVTEDDVIDLYNLAIDRLSE